MAERDDLEGLVRRHQHGVWEYLRMLGCPPDEAEDLAQETFLVLLRKRFRERHPAATGCYLRRTARYLAMDRRRRRGAAGNEDWADAVDGVWEEQRAVERAEPWLTALRLCRDRLRGRSRRAVELFYGDGLSRADVAARLGMKENGVKTLLHRLRAGLRACVEREMP